MADFSTEKFVDFVKFFDKGNPNHVKAMLTLASSFPPQLLCDEATWVKTYRTPPVPINPTVLSVPYFSQRDNYRDAARTCFSSSCAMLTEYLKPGTLPGPKGDDKYLQQVFAYGDTTDANVQVQVLNKFGVTAKFTTSGTFATLDSQLKAGVPVPIGILHHGPGSAPSGLGHWIIVIGKDGDNYVVNDPWGKLDDSMGEYVSTDGNHVRYGKPMLQARWTVEGDGSGWAILASK
jgi:Papain-like cysteine protease AvrRpt2